MTDDEAVNFETAFTELISLSGWSQKNSSAYLIQRWKSFSQDCADGYPWDVEDYLNDLTLRTTLNQALAQTSRHYPECTRELLRQVEAADEIVRAVLTKESFTKFPEHHWWLRNTPSYASQAFCEEFRRTHGVTVRASSKYDDSLSAVQRILVEASGRPQAFVEARNTIPYLADRPPLLFRAIRATTALQPRERRALSRWTQGELRDQDLRDILPS